MKRKTKAERLKALTALGAKPLAETLLGLSLNYPEIDKAIEQLIAGPQEQVKIFRECLDMAGDGPFLYRYKVSELARELTAALEGLKNGVKDPKVGMKLIAELYEEAENIFERIHDEDGEMTDFFSCDVPLAFKEFSERCSDKTWVKTHLLKILTPVDLDQDIDRTSLVTYAANDLAPKEIASLLQEFQSRRDDDDDPERWNWYLGELAKQTKNPEVFVQARAAVREDLSSNDLLEIAETFLESGQPKTAQEWLDKVGPEGKNDYRSSFERLQLRVFEALHDAKGQNDTAWLIFSNQRDLDSLELLLGVIGEQRRQEVVDLASKSILSAEKFRYEDARFLMDSCQIPVLETYMRTWLHVLKGDDYYVLPPFAHFLQEHGRFWISTMLYRLLLDSLLERGYAKSYHHGVDYLKALASMAPSIEDWEDRADHSEYYSKIYHQHKRKYSFWQRYQS